MKSNSIKFTLIPLVAVASFSVLGADAYDVIDLGKLNGNQSFAYDINEAGQVIGTANGSASDADGNNIAFLGHPVIYANDVVTDVGTLDNGFVGEGSGFSINDLGQGTGYSQLSVQTPRVDANGDPELDENGNQIIDSVLYDVAVVYDGVGGLTQIPQLEAGTQAAMRGLSINSNGYVVGWSNYNPPNDTNTDGTSIETNFNRGFLFDPADSSVQRVDPLTSDTEDGLQSVLRDINENNRAVGWSTKRVDGVQTTTGIWIDAANPTVVNELDAFGGSATIPYSINDVNQVVGLATNAENTSSSAFIYNLDTNEVTDIGFFDANLNQPSTAYDINNAGIAVGQAFADSLRGVYHAFIYENNLLSDLNNRIDCSSGWELITARGINEAGEIVGTGSFEGEARAFKLVPRASGQREACPVEETNSGSGSAGWIFLSILSLLGLGRKKH